MTAKESKAVAWLPAWDAPQGVEVLTKIDDANGCRNETTLTRKGNLWFFPDMSTYVYYAPTHYALLASDGGADGDNEV